MGLIGVTRYCKLVRPQPFLRNYSPPSFPRFLEIPYFLRIIAAHSLPLSGQGSRVSTFSIATLVDLNLYELLSTTIGAPGKFQR